MSIKYGELTIIYNEKPPTLFDSLVMWFNDTQPTKTKYVFLFDDGEIRQLIPPKNITETT